MIFFNKSNLTRKEQRETEIIKRDGRGKLIASVIIYGMLFALFSFNFEVKLLGILSNSSMLDETDSLSTFDRIFIKRKADKLFENFGLPFSFLITESPLNLSQVDKSTFYIAIEDKSYNSIVSLPEELSSYEAKVDYVLRSCLHKQQANSTRDYAACLEQSLVLLNANMESQGYKKLQSKSFNLFEAQQNFN